MDRLACVDVEPLRLQLLGQAKPSWRDAPFAVVTRDGPDGLVVEVNGHARRKGVRSGVRLATALSLCPELRAGQVDAARLDQASAQIAALLYRFSPDVEHFERGTFIVRASGLTHIAASESAWAVQLRHTLHDALGLRSSVGVAASRLGAIVAARQRGARGKRCEVTLLEGPEDDRQAIALAPLALFSGWSPKVSRRLQQLGIGHIGQLLELPADSVLRRLGPEIYRLHRLATGHIHLPLAPLPHRERFGAREELEFAERNSVRLLFVLKRMLVPLLRRCGSRGWKVRALEIVLTLESGRRLEEHIAAAEPTLDAATWGELVRLRFEHIALVHGVTQVGLKLVTVRVAAGQLALLPSRSRREVAKAEEGLARVRAEFGDAVVVEALIHEEHLPERRWCWSGFEALPEAATLPLDIPARPHEPGVALVRRVIGRSLSLMRDPISDLGPPSFVSWGWWSDAPERGAYEYRFARLASGTTCWLRRDAATSPWIVAAVVQ